MCRQSGSRLFRMILNPLFVRAEIYPLTNIDFHFDLHLKGIWYLVKLFNSAKYFMLAENSLYKNELFHYLKLKIINYIFSFFF